MPRSLLFVASALLVSGCGYIGEPLPPALHIPVRVTDLSAVQRGSQIVVDFTLPTHSTEGLILRKPPGIELRVGPGTNPYQEDAWVAGSRAFSEAPADKPVVHYAVPAGEWTGKDVLIGVKIIGSTERDAGWSNLVVLSIISPLERPDGLDAKAVAQGVRLVWRATSPRYRVYRREGDVSSDTPLAESDRAEYIDTTAEYGKTYYYSVEGLHWAGDVRAVSLISNEAPITPEDKFPPAVPAGLAVLASTASIELVWERDTDSDLAGYRIYRAQGAGPLEKLGETADAPSYSDRKTEPGKPYRYAVSAFDKAGNESSMSAPVEITAQ